MIYRLSGKVLLVLTLLASALPVRAEVAQFKDIVDCDRTAAAETHPMMRLASGKAKVLAVQRPVARVVVDHPGRLGVFVKSPGTLDLLARRESGIAHFTALDKDGKIVMARYVFVGDRAVRYVRAHTGGKESLYFCPDQCFEMKLN